MITRMDPNSRGRVQISVEATARRWWNDLAVREGIWAANRKLLAELWNFIFDSTPERRRRRYGDAEYDWEHRVDTTSGTVGWRTRLLGVFLSPYQPTDAVLFHEMLDDLQRRTGCDFRGFAFVDLGSGKGRTLLMAADYPFNRIAGVELLPELHSAAQQNISGYKSESQKCFAIESICADAAEFVFPDEPIVLYLFNPLPESSLRRVLANLTQSLRSHRRAVYVVYHNPLLESVLVESAALEKISGTHQYVVYAAP